MNMDIKKLLASMVCLGILFTGCVSDAVEDPRMLSDGRIPEVSENVGEIQTEVSEVNVVGEEESGTEVREETTGSEAACCEQNDAYKLFYGTWEITEMVEQRRAPEDWGAAYEAGYEDILGMEVTYLPDVYEFGDIVRVENPDYLMRILPTSAAWMEHFSAPASLIPEDEIFVWVTIYNFPDETESGISYGFDSYVGKNFFIKDDNTLYCYAYDRYFEMKRVGWLGDESEKENGEENEINEAERKIVYEQNEAYKLYYGTWEICSVVSQHSRLGGNDGYEDVLGTEVTYLPNSYGYGDNVQVNDPKYQIYIMPMSAAALSWQERNIYSLLPGAEYFVWVEVANLPEDNKNGDIFEPDKYIGNTFFIKDENTMYCVNNNCIYEMTRVDFIPNHDDYYQYWGPGITPVKYSE